MTFSEGSIISYPLVFFQVTPIDTGERHGFVVSKNNP